MLFFSKRKPASPEELTPEDLERIGDVCGLLQPSDAHREAWRLFRIFLRKDSEAFHRAYDEFQADGSFTTEFKEEVKQLVIADLAKLYRDTRPV